MKSRKQSERQLLKRFIKQKRTKKQLPKINTGQTKQTATTAILLLNKLQYSLLGEYADKFAEPHEKPTLIKLMNTTIEINDAIELKLSDLSRELIEARADFVYTQWVLSNYVKPKNEAKVIEFLNTMV